MNKRQQEVEQFYLDHANDPLVINDYHNEEELRPRYALYDELKTKLHLPIDNTGEVS